MSISNHKQKALNHVRSMCPELMELSLGCKVSLEDGAWPDGYVIHKMENGAYCQYKDDYYSSCHFPIEDIEIIGHTPHLENFVFSAIGEEIELKLLPVSKTVTIQKPLNDDYYSAAHFDLTKDGESQLEEFYKAYCEIVGV